MLQIPQIQIDMRQSHIPPGTPLVLFYLFIFFTVPLHAQLPDERPGTVPSEVIADWESQDRISTNGYPIAINRIVSVLSGAHEQEISGEQSDLESVPSNDTRWRDLYIKACHYRRIQRIKPYADKCKNIVFTSHYTMGALFQGFQEGIGSNKCSNYRGGAALCLLTMDDYYPTYGTLRESATGVIKDPDVSYDGKKILFAETRDNNGFHLYEMEAANPHNVRQLTSNPPDLRISDFDGCYLPNGDILFQSSRCFGLVDCFYNITSNLYICDKDGNYLRRVGYDQVQTFYPTMMDDGRVLYTRWEYNDRSQVYSMGLFTMNPDGTQQNEFYGNQSWWPTSIIQARNIPGTSKVLAILSGHHTTYSGQIAVIDPNLGRQEGNGITLLAPEREPRPVRRDNGGVDFLFQTPYPLDEECFLVGYRRDAGSNFSLYFMNTAGDRELLAWDYGRSLNKPVPLYPREKPPLIASPIDYTQTTGTYTMQDIHVGTGLPGIPKGTIKKLRVVALDYRVDNAIGYTFWRTNEFDLSAHTYTPIARSSGSWDVKRILGETPVYEDGSASFTVPARTPVFFQAIDSTGSVVQTMRSWSTLMPGETFSCVGCHEDKNSAPPAVAAPLAGDPEPLEPFYGIENKGFSYPEFIQPIFDDKCVRCHNAAHERGLDLRANPVYADDLSAAWRTEFNDRDYMARKSWNLSYLELTEVRGKYIEWNTTQSYPTGMPPYFTGSSKSPLIEKLRAGHSNLSLSRREMDLLSAWIDLCIPHSGSYTEGMNTNDRNSYNNSLARRIKWETIEAKNIEEFIENGQYGSASIRYDNRAKGATEDNNRQCRIVRNGTITLTISGPGTFSLIDLKGTRLHSVSCNRNHASGTGTFTITLPNHLPSGTYIGMFTSSTYPKFDFMRRIVLF